MPNEKGTKYDVKPSKKLEKKIDNGKIELDPRQRKFLANYLDPKSKTFGDCTNSGISAGFGKKYSEVILHRDLDWLSDIIKDTYMIQRAEKNLKESMEIECYEKDDKGIERINPSIFRTKLDVSKFVAERLNKEKYSPRVEEKIEKKVLNINITLSDLKPEQLEEFARTGKLKL